MRYFRVPAAAILVSALTAAALTASADPMADNFIGKFKVATVLDNKYVLADPAGLTIYTFEKDEPGKSNCAGACAEQWPPVLAIPADAPFEDFPIIVRADGARQWTYKNQPLYRSAKDTAPGQANGNGADDAWYALEIPAHDM